nr:hypothetical protein [Tanacetum cinerariifolium]
MSQFVQITHTHQYVVPFRTKKLFTTLRVNSPSFSGRIVPLFDTMLVHQGEGSGTPTEPHHTSFPEVPSSHPPTSSIPLPSIPTAPIPTVTQTDTTPIIQYSRRARIVQSSALPTVADKPASLVRDDSQGEACPTDSGFIADQDRATIAKSSIPTAPIPPVTQPVTTPIIQYSRRARIAQSSALLTVADKPASPVRDVTAERISNNSDEIARVLTSMDAATVLAGGINVPTGKKEDMRMNEQIVRDAEVARIHAEEELQGMIDSLDQSNETIAK